MGLTGDLVDFITATEFDDLPQPVVHRTKEILLDSIGCALGGHVTDRAKIALEIAQDFGGSLHSAIIGGPRTSCPLAAFVNAELINALDYDATGPAPHTAPYVIPPALAVGERLEASGKDLITAIALAHEVGGRAALSLGRHRVLTQDPPHYEESPRFSYNSTVFGAVAGAGKLIGLDTTQMTNALGIAGASTPAPGMMKWEYTSGPAFMVKYNGWTGWVAQLATVAALAAERGFTGDPSILEGEWGHWKIMGSPLVEIDTLVGDLGTVWRVLDVGFKPYPACRINHTGIGAIAKLVRENGIRPEEIEEIVVKGDPLLLLPNRAMTEIRTFEDAQFCNAYVFALAACSEDRPGPGWQLASQSADPVVRSLMKRVRVEKHPRTDELIVRALQMGRSSFFDVIVELVARGRKYVAQVSEPKGSATDPISDQELEQKFRDNADYSPLTRAKIEELIQLIWHLEHVDDVAKLGTLLAAR